MLHTFLMIFALTHGTMSYNLIEAPSKEACEASRGDVLKSVIDKLHPDAIDVKCVEVTLATVS